MPKINGDWFHSRSSSNLSELLKVRDILNESKKDIYSELAWSGGRNGNQKLYDLAAAAYVKPSTLQTKIRTMIRFGFIEDDNKCPIMWSRMGQIWNDVYTSGDKDIANKIYQLTLITSLSTMAFTEESYILNPSKGSLPLKYLLNNLNEDNFISISDFSDMVDGDKDRVGENASYWKNDLINSGLFKQLDDKMIYTGLYSEFVNDIKNFIPDSNLLDEDWIKIKQNPLIEISPFKDSIRKIFEGIINSNNFEEINVSDPIAEVMVDQLDNVLPETDILSNETRYATSIRKVRNSTWAKRVKKRYNNKCAIPECDTQGTIFVEGCHVKPDNIEEGLIPHRAHILNGICMCSLCHKLFDEGYFSLDDDSKIIVSSFLDELPKQRATDVIKMSENKKIKSSTDGRLPLQEFMEYHRVNILKK